MLGIFFTVRIMDVLPISLSNCEQWRSQEFDLGGIRYKLRFASF